MPKKYRKTRTSVIVLITALIIVAALATWGVQYTMDPGYWIAAAGFFVTVAIFAVGLVSRSPGTRASSEIDDVIAELVVAVTEQWQGEVRLKVDSPYPLHVPFAAPADADRVMAGWAAIRSERGSAPIPLKGHFDQIAEVFGQPGMPKRLVVLGEPGRGKSMIVQWLMLQLLRSLQESKPLPSNFTVPVFLPVANWSPAEPLADWAAARMAENYQSLAKIVPDSKGAARTLAYRIVTAHRVLLILDGLDEMAQHNFGMALDRLSEAVVGGHHLVITCRTSEYRQIMATTKRAPLAKTPVVELAPLPMAEVCAYLRDANSSEIDRWEVLLDHLEAEPEGTLASALSCALNVWLVRTVYRDTDSSPEKLVDIAASEGSEGVTRHLLAALVEATYGQPSDPYPARRPKQVEGVHKALVLLARYLNSREDKNGREDKQDIEWWRLHQVVPRTVIGVSIGLIVGSLLGAVVGLVMGVRAGFTAGIGLGTAFGIVTGVLAGITCARVQEKPRAVNLSFSSRGLSKADVAQQLGRCIGVGLAVGLGFGYAVQHGGGLLSGLVTAVIVGPVAALADSSVFGAVPGITAGVTAALAVGLAGGLATGRTSAVLAGLVAGLAFMAGTWVWIGIYQPAATTTAVSPKSLFTSDRLGCLVVGGTAGSAFGILYSLALGPAVGILAAVGLFVSITLTVSLWGTFCVARVWLAFSRGTPLGIMSFLHEAHERGILRQVGGAYQFRHDRLQQQLAEVPAEIVKAVNPVPEALATATDAQAVVPEARAAPATDQAVPATDKGAPRKA